MQSTFALIALNATPIRCSVTWTLGAIHPLISHHQFISLQSLKSSFEMEEEKEEEIWERYELICEFRERNPSYFCQSMPRLTITQLNVQSIHVCMLE